MRMNHINLSVPDVPKTRAFFETYFGLHCSESPQPEKIVILIDESDDSIIALSNFSKNETYAYPAAFHVGFNLPSREDVDAMHARLAADGHAVGKRIEFHGAWTFYLEAPGGFMVEVFHQDGMEGLRASAGLM